MTGEAMSVADAQARTESKLTSVIPDLERLGLLERFNRPVDRVPVERTERFVRVLSTEDSLAARSVKQRTVLDHLRQRSRLARSSDPGILRYRELVDLDGVDASTLKALVAKGALEIFEMPVSIFEKAIEPSRPPLLSQLQVTSWNQIERTLKRRSSKPILVHGVTGSGKTELYLRAAAWGLRNELGTIVLVPEIALATQVVRRFEERFPGRVAVIHSELGDADRYTTWTAIARGERPIVVGPRSALFAPIQQLGAIIIDEEQDGAYKQDTAAQIPGDSPGAQNRPGAVQLTHPGQRHSVGRVVLRGHQRRVRARVAAGANRLLTGRYRFRSTGSLHVHAGSRHRRHAA